MSAKFQKTKTILQYKYGLACTVFMKDPAFFKNIFLGCSVAQLVVRWLAVKQARVRISARHPMEVPPTEPTAMKIWRWASMNVYE